VRRRPVLRARADPQARNEDGKTPAEWLEERGLDEIADLMSDLVSRR
jgi:hypothetical protein